MTMTEAHANLLAAGLREFSIDCSLMQRPAKHGLSDRTEVYFSVYAPGCDIAEAESLEDAVNIMLADLRPAAGDTLAVADAATAGI